MTDARDHERSDEAIERDRGLSAALLELWNPGGRPMAVSWEDSCIITADEATRSRLTVVDAVVHALLRFDLAGARERLSAMSGLMRAFVALRSVTLADEVLSAAPRGTRRLVLLRARATAATLLGPDAEAAAGADRLDAALRGGGEPRRRPRILACVSEAASPLSSEGRLGVGAYGAAVVVEALRTVRADDPKEMLREHTALMVAVARGQAVTYRHGRLVIDG